MQTAPGLRLSDVDLPIIDGRYELGPLGNLGCPGVGLAPRVYHAAQISDRQGLVLFELPESTAADEVLMVAIEKEVSLLQRVGHSRLVAVHEVVKHAHQRFVVLDEAGLTLGRMLHLATAARVRIPAAVVSRIVLDALEGLGALHTQLSSLRAGGNCSHCELSPEGIWVSPTGRARLLDTGYGRALEAARTAKRHEATWSLPYASPERVTGTKAGISSDTYSACVVLWEALTETRLFARRTKEETIEAILDGDIPPSEAMNLGSEIDLSFVTRGLGYDGPERYLAASDLARELARQLPPATPSQVAEWLRRLDPGFGVVRSEARALVAQQAEEDEATRMSTLSELPDAVDELTLIACDVSDEGAWDSRLSPAQADERVKKLVRALGLAAGSLGNGPPSRRKQFSVDSVSPKLIERLAAAEAAEHPAAGSLTPSDAPLASGVVTSALSAPRSLKKRGSPVRHALLVAVGVAVGTAVSVVWAPKTNLVSHAPSLSQVSKAQVGAAVHAVESPVCPKLEPATEARNVDELPFAPRSEHRQPAPAARVAVPSAQRESLGPASVEVSEAPSPAVAAGEPRIVVPRSLHPRINPLMNSQQVFSSRD